MKSERRSNLYYSVGKEPTLQNEIAALRPAPQDFARNDKRHFYKFFYSA